MTRKSGYSVFKKILFTVACLFIAFGAMADDAVSSRRFLSLVLWDVYGNPISLESLKGKPVLVNFYASWCASCINEVKDINKLKAENGGKFEIIGVSLDNDTQIVRKFMLNNNMNYVSLVSGGLGSGIMKSLGNKKNGLPFSVFIEKSGAISFAKLGSLNKQELDGFVNRMSY
jgi:thiol-disulfide isomerase/thioredoxin